MVKSPLPWGLKSLCMTVFYLVPAKDVRDKVPHPLKVSEVVPGFTIGGLYAARYGAVTNSLSEFGLLQAYVSYGDKKGFFMRNFCMEGKESADGCGCGAFSWDAGGKWLSLEVSSGGERLVNLRMRPIVQGIPFSANMPFLCVKGNNVVYFQNHFISKIGISNSKVTVPEGSPLMGYPFRYKLISTFWDTANVVLKEPEYATAHPLKRHENALGTPIGKTRA
jgi:hypothetical protein